MNKANTRKQDESIVIQTWGDYDFKLFPGSKSTKPYVHFQFLNPNTGKEERQRKLTGLTPGASLSVLKQQAKITIEALKDLLANGWNPIDNSFNDLPITPLSPISDCIDYWLKQRQLQYDNKSMKKKTLDMNTYLMSYLKKWLTEKKYSYRKPSSFTKIDIDNFLQTTALDRNWGKISYNCYRTDTGTFFGYLKTLKIIPENPVPLSVKKNTKKDSSRFKIFEEDELTNVVKLLANDKAFRSLYIASKLVYLYNIRPVEITRIQVSNIDLDKRLLTLRPEQTKNGDEAVFKLNDEIYNLFDDLIVNQPSHYFVFTNRSKPSDKQLSKDYFGARWRYFRIIHNIPDRLKFYALKHTSNYYDLEDGASYEEIRQRNRHANLQVTTLYVKERLYKNQIKASNSNRF